MRVFIFLAILCYSAFGISNYTAPVLWKTAGDTVTASKLNRNDSAGPNWSRGVADTMNNKIPRWVHFSNHDSTFRWMDIDTIPSANAITAKNVAIDHANIDTIGAVDSINTVKLLSRKIYTDTVTSVDTMDFTAIKGTRLYADTSILRGASFTSRITGDASAIMRLDGKLYVGVGSETNQTSELIQSEGACWIDTLRGTQGVRYPRGYIGTVSCTTATFYGNVNVDSLRSAKGLRSAAGIYGTIGSFSSTVSVDSLYSTKGITSAGKVSASGGLVSSADIYSTQYTSYSHSTSGFSAFTSDSVCYKKIGKTVFLWYNIVGTSNSTSFSFTLPVAPKSSGAKINQYYFKAGYSLDNGTYKSDVWVVLNQGSTTCTFYLPVGVWTNSGDKSAVGYFCYEID